LAFEDATIVHAVSLNSNIPVIADGGIGQDLEATA
jgi:imidazole glycerol phosphate synthase subunit HisF